MSDLFEKTATGTEKASTGFNRLGTEAERTSNKVTGLAKTILEASKKMEISAKQAQVEIDKRKLLQKNLKESDARYKELTKQIENQVRAQKNQAAAMAQATADAAKLTAGHQKYLRELQLVNAQLEAQGDKLRGVAKASGSLASAMKRGVGAIGNVSATLGAQAISIKGVVEAHKEYTAAFYNLSRVQTTSGKGMKDYSNALKIVRQNTSLADVDFAKLATSIASTYRGIAPTTTEMAKLASMMSQTVGPSIEAVTEATKVWLGLQDKFPAMADRIKSAQEALLAGDEKLAKRRQANILMQMSAMGASISEMREVVKMTTKSTGQEQNRAEILKKHANLQKSAKNMMKDNGEANEKAIMMGVEAMTKFNEALGRTPALARTAAIAMAALSAAAALPEMIHNMKTFGSLLKGLRGGKGLGNLFGGGKGGGVKGLLTKVMGKGGKGGGVKGLLTKVMGGGGGGSKAIDIGKGLTATTTKGTGGVTKLIIGAAKSGGAKAAGRAGLGFGSGIFASGTSAGAAAAAAPLATGAAVVGTAIASYKIGKLIGDRIGEAILNAPDKDRDDSNKRAKIAHMQRTNKDFRGQYARSGLAGESDIDKQFAGAEKLMAKIKKEQQGAAQAGKEHELSAVTMQFAYEKMSANLKVITEWTKQTVQNQGEIIDIQEKFGLLSEESLAKRLKLTQALVAKTKDQKDIELERISAQMGAAGFDVEIDVNDAEKSLGNMQTALEKVEAQLIPLENQEFNMKLDLSQKYGVDAGSVEFDEKTKGEKDYQDVLKKSVDLETKRDTLLGNMKKVSETSLTYEKALADEAERRVEAVTRLLNQETSNNELISARLDTERKLMESMQFGLGASIEMMQKQVNLTAEMMKDTQEAGREMQKNLKIQLKKADVSEEESNALISQVENARVFSDVTDAITASGLDQEKVAKDITAYWKEYQKNSKKTMDYQQKIYDLTKNMREGYLDAIQAMSFGAGEFEKIIGTQDMGVTQLMDSMKAATGEEISTMAYGGRQDRALTRKGTGTQLSGEYTTSGPVFVGAQGADNVNDRAGRITGYYDSMNNASASVGTALVPEWGKNVMQEQGQGVITPQNLESSNENGTFKALVKYGRTQIGQKAGFMNRGSGLLGSGAKDPRTAQQQGARVVQGAINSFGTTGAPGRAGGHFPTPGNSGGGIAAGMNIAGTPGGQQVVRELTTPEGDKIRVTRAKIAEGLQQTILVMQDQLKNLKTNSKDYKMLSKQIKILSKSYSNNMKEIEKVNTANTLATGGGVYHFGQTYGGQGGATANVLQGKKAEGAAGAGGAGGAGSKGYPSVPDYLKEVKSVDEVSGSYEGIKEKQRGIREAEQEVIEYEAEQAKESQWRQKEMQLAREKEQEYSKEYAKYEAMPDKERKKHKDEENKLAKNIIANTEDYRRNEAAEQAYQESQEAAKGGYNLESRKKDEEKLIVLEAGRAERKERMMTLAKLMHPEAGKAAKGEEYKRLDKEFQDLHTEGTDAAKQESNIRTRIEKYNKLDAKIKDYGKDYGAWTGRGIAGTQYTKEKMEQQGLEVDWMSGSYATEEAHNEKLAKWTVDTENRDRDEIKAADRKKYEAEQAKAKKEADEKKKAAEAARKKKAKAEFEAEKAERMSTKLTPVMNAIDELEGKGYQRVDDIMGKESDSFLGKSETREKGVLQKVLEAGEGGTLSPEDTAKLKQTVQSYDATGEGDMSIEEHDLYSKLAGGEKLTAADVTSANERFTSLEREGKRRQNSIATGINNVTMQDTGEARTAAYVRGEKEVEAEMAAQGWTEEGGATAAADAQKKAFSKAASKLNTKAGQEAAFGKDTEEAKRYKELLRKSQLASRGAGKLTEEERIEAQGLWKKGMATLSEGKLTEEQAGEIRDQKLGKKKKITADMGLKDKDLSRYEELAAKQKKASKGVGTITKEESAEMLALKDKGMVAAHEAAGTKYEAEKITKKDIKADMGLKDEELTRYNELKEKQIKASKGVGTITDEEKAEGRALSEKGMKAAYKEAGLGEYKGGAPKALKAESGLEGDDLERYNELLARAKKQKKGIMTGDEKLTEDELKEGRDLQAKGMAVAKKKAEATGGAGAVAGAAAGTAAGVGAPGVKAAEGAVAAVAKQSLNLLQQGKKTSAHDDEESAGDRGMHAVGLSGGGAGDDKTVHLELSKGAQRLLVMADAMAANMGESLDV